MNGDQELEADVARLREKWFGADAAPRRSLDAEEEAIAAKWLGKDEASRLAHIRTGQKFRPAIVIAHWGYVPEVWNKFSQKQSGGWYAETFANGHKATVFEGEFDGCMQAVSNLQRMGISVTRVGKEAPPAPVRAADREPTRSKRFDMIDDLRGFRRGRR